ncbi:MAG: acyl-CoA desaturase [Thermoanaerobaculia bacterium]
MIATNPSPALEAPADQPKRLTAGDWLRSIPFVAVHLAALLVFVVPFAWKWVGLCLGLYLVRMFGVTAGYHRYFSHKTYRTSRWFQAVLAVLGLLALQKGPLWWAAHHRHHHLHSDDPEDLHSPRRNGFLWAHLGWVVSDAYDETQFERIPDFARFPELVWLNRYHLVPGVTLAVLLFLLGGLPALAWGFFLSTVLTWHVTFMINSLTHMIGRRRYATTDDSRNSLILALLTLGEGWHNNHHYYQASTRQGFFWWEIDIAYYLLKMLSWVGLVWDLREPPRRVYEAARA